MKSLEVNKLLAVYLFGFMSVLFAFYLVVENAERKQIKIASHISGHLIPDIRTSIQIRDELIGIKKSLHDINRVQDDKEASRLEVSRIRSGDQLVLKEFYEHRQRVKRHDESAGLSELEKVYQPLHLQLSDFYDGYFKAKPSKEPTLYDEALKEVLKLNESLIEDYQAHIRQAATTLTEQSILSNKLLIGALFFLSIIVGIGYRLYRQVVSMLGAEPKLFVSDLSQLLKGQLLEKCHAQDTLIGRVEHILTTDELTKLPNRLGLKRWLKQNRAGRTKATFFLLHINGLNLVKDHFEGTIYTKEINLLIDHLRGLLHEGGCLGKIDSETFVIINTTLDGATDIGNYATLLLESTRQASLSKTRLSMLKVSIGIAHEAVGLFEPDLSMKHALFALEKARDNDGNNYVLFDPALLAQEKQRLELLGDLRKALQDKEFTLAFQPQVEFKSGAIVGVEALIRWQHPQQGMISPGIFIPIAEESGLIDGIGDWVLTQAIKAAKDIHSKFDQLIPVSINVSSRQFLSNNFALKVERLLAENQCHPAWVKLEITESVMLDNSSELRKTMMEIAQKGVSICLDDFGTGYSSLSYLTQYPISQIKIDRGFMSDIAIRLDSQALVKTIVQISELFQFEIVAEGVESEDQLDFLSKTSCHIVQGFLYYKPMPYAALLAVLEQKNQ